MHINYCSLLWQEGEEYINHGDDEPERNNDSTFFMKRVIQFV